MISLNTAQPYASDIESKVLASLIHSGFPLKVLQTLVKEIKIDGWSPKHRNLVQLVAKNVQNGNAVSLEQLSALVVHHQLPTDLAARYSAPGDVKAGIATINEMRWVSKTQQALQKIQEAYTKEATTETAAELLKLVTGFVRVLDSHVNGENVQVVRAFTRERIEALLKPDVRTMYPTGVSSIDKMIGGGIQAKRMLLLSSNAKGAKTTMACAMAAYMIQHQIPVRYVTLEVSAEDVERRIASHLTGAVHRDLWTRDILNQMTAQDQQDWVESLDDKGLSKYLQIVDCSGALCSPLRVQEEVASMTRGVVIVDHVGLIDDSGTKDANYRFRVRLMEDLHRAIQKQNAALITVAQLNDDGKLAGAKQQNQSVDYHFSWVLSSVEHESRICCINPMDFRIPADRYPLYFRLDFDHQAFLPLSSDDQAVLDYLEAKSAGAKAKSKSAWNAAREEGL